MGKGGIMAVLGLLSHLNLLVFRQSNGPWDRISDRDCDQKRFKVFKGIG